MDPLTIAMLGSSAIGGSSSKKASHNAAQASAAQIELGYAGLDLQKQGFELTKQQYEDAKAEYDRWKRVYGPLQEDLGTYYRNLTGQKLSAREVSNIQAASEKASDKIVQSLAQSGRANSGLESYLLAQNAYGAELDKANARSTADERAQAQKLNFLGVGLGQANQLRVSQGNSVAGLNANLRSQAATLNSIGNAQVLGANQQNVIQQNFANQLQGNLGFAARYGLFGSSVPTATPNVAGVLSDNGVLY